MKLFNFKTIFAFAAGCAALCSAACSDDDGIDNRERDYGYIQFKIYKEASYPELPPRSPGPLSMNSITCMPPGN